MSTSVKKKNADHWFSSDSQFNKLYPPDIIHLAKRHWTPLSVARRASYFLAAEKNTRILDIGSGVGKFCLSAAYYNPHAFYYGVEQRKSLTEVAQAAQEMLDIDNVSFNTANFTQLDFSDFDHFYFYNSFYENLAGSDKIDDTIQYSGQLFNYYNHYLFKQLELKQAGTRVATFYSLEDEMPPSYHIVGSEFDNQLKFWVKV